MNEKIFGEESLFSSSEHQTIRRKSPNTGFEFDPMDSIYHEEAEPSGSYMDANSREYVSVRPANERVRSQSVHEMGKFAVAATFAKHEDIVKFGVDDAMSLAGLEGAQRLTNVIHLVGDRMLIEAEERFARLSEQARIDAEIARRPSENLA